MHQIPPPADFLPVVEAYTEKISATVTTNHATLEALVSSNARLYATTKKQHANMESLRAEISTLRTSVNPGGGGNNTGHLLADQEKQLLTKLKKGCYIGCF